MAYKTIITCDICDSVMDADDVSKLDMIYCADKSKNNQISKAVHYDLCPKCATKIGNYLRNLKEDYNAR